MKKKHLANVLVFFSFKIMYRFCITLSCCAVRTGAILQLTPQPSLVGYLLRLPTQGWPGWVDLDGCLHKKTIPRTISRLNTRALNNRFESIRSIDSTERIELKLISIWLTNFLKY